MADRTRNRKEIYFFKKLTKNGDFFNPETDTDPDQKPTFKQKTDPDPNGLPKVNPAGL
jgi:hypothetical protein